MEYEFLRDPTFGGYHAKFSMEHELFAAWLMEEIAADEQKLDKLQQCIKKASVLQYEDIHFTGREYILTFAGHEVSLALNSSCDGIGGGSSFEQMTEQLVEQALAIDGDYHSNTCGLDDFALMIKAWRDFIV